MKEATVLGAFVHHHVLDDQSHGLVGMISMLQPKRPRTAPATGHARREAAHSPMLQGGQSVLSQQQTRSLVDKMATTDASKLKASSPNPLGSSHLPR